MKSHQEVTCLRCKRVSFAVSAAYARQQTDDFNDFFAKLPDDKKKMFACGPNGADIRSYFQCMQCGNSFKNFRDAVEGGCPMGCTLSPVVRYDETLAQIMMAIPDPAVLQQVIADMEKSCK
jgi:hypothetical protein